MFPGEEVNYSDNLIYIIDGELPLSEWGLQLYAAWFALSNFIVPLSFLSYFYAKIIITIYKNMKTKVKLSRSATLRCSYTQNKNGTTGGQHNSCSVKITGFKEQHKECIILPAGQGAYGRIRSHSLRKNHLTASMKSKSTKSNVTFEKPNSRALSVKIVRSPTQNHPLMNSNMSDVSPNRKIHINELSSTNITDIIPSNTSSPFPTPPKLRRRGAIRKKRRPNRKKEMHFERSLLVRSDASGSSNASDVVTMALIGRHDGLLPCSKGGVSCMGAKRRMAFARRRHTDIRLPTTRSSSKGI